MAERILITGGSGMIGRHLMPLLIKEGFEVGILSRKEVFNNDVKTWKWDIDKGIIDEEALQFADHIIHLAGANLSERKWSKARKKIILDSRVKSTQLLIRKLSESGRSLKSFISASGTSYYGWNTGSIIMDEDRKKPGDDFLAVVVKEWEAAVQEAGKYGIRTVILRNGPVISHDGAFLQKIMPVVKLGLAAGIGTGEQYISWIHIRDLCGIILMAINDTSIQGIFNAVAPGPVTNMEMMKAIAKSNHKPFFLPNVPAFIIRLLYGEMSSTVLGSSRVSSSRIESMGFEFRYRNINEALNSL
jgi:uncharacterized protein